MTDAQEEEEEEGENVESITYGFAVGNNCDRDELKRLQRSFRFAAAAPGRGGGPTAAGIGYSGREGRGGRVIE